MTKNITNPFICFRPVPYVLPPLYAIILTLGILYVAASCFRAWIVYKEEKISNTERLFCQGCYLYLAWAGILFSISFAVQPIDHESTIMHTAPFTIFCVSLLMNQVSLTYLPGIWVRSSSDRSSSGRNPLAGVHWQEAFDRSSSDRSSGISLTGVLWQVLSLTLINLIILPKCKFFRLQ